MSAIFIISLLSANPACFLHKLPSQRNRGQRLENFGSARYPSYCQYVEGCHFATYSPHYPTLPGPSAFAFLDEKVNFFIQKQRMQLVHVQRCSSTFTSLLVDTFLLFEAAHYHEHRSLRSLCYCYSTQRIIPGSSTTTP